MQAIVAAGCCPADSCSISTVSLLSLIEQACGECSETAVENIAALREVSVHPNDSVKLVLGEFVVGDGAGGWWRYDEDSTAADNGYSVIHPDNVAVGSPGNYLQFL